MNYVQDILEVANRAKDNGDDAVAVILFTVAGTFQVPDQRPTLLLSDICGEFSKAMIVVVEENIENLRMENVKDLINNLDLGSERDGSNMQ